MQVELRDSLQGTPQGDRLKEGLSKCVHCGFCNATCPTYRLTGHELEGPRGRIDLIKQMAEGQKVGPKTRLYLDHCLHCLSCETTCPSGVSYGHLIDEGRVLAEEIHPQRPLFERIFRRGLVFLLSQDRLLRFGMPFIRHFKRLLPQHLRAMIQPLRPVFLIPEVQKSRGNLLYLAGCIEPTLQPAIESALCRVLGALAYTPHRAEGEQCCGALAFHLGHQAEALAAMRRNIDAWWPYVEGTVSVLQGRGVEAILASSSGCGAMIQSYADYLQEDPVYAEKAKRISDLFRDPVEWLWGEVEPLKARIKAAASITLHEPCSLQHGLQLKGRLEPLLAALGCEVRKDAAPELCCGAGGAYSLLYPEISAPLRAQKRRDLGMGLKDEPAVVVSSNIGCLQYLSTSEQPVLHWLEWLAIRLDEAARELQTTPHSPRE